MEIAFGVLSSREPKGTLEQLVQSLGEDDPVFVHHDFSKRPGVDLNERRAYLIPDYVKTGWGTEHLVHAIFHLIRTALKRSRFDYFQLLSPSCLPLRPVEELRRYLRNGQHAVHADILNLDEDERVMMSHGHRDFCRTEKVASRLLSRSRRWYLGADPATFHLANLGIEHRSDSLAPLTPLQWVGKQIHQAARAGLLDNHPFRGGTAPQVGSLWLCLRRDVCEYLVPKEYSDPAVAYLKGLKMCDEIVFSTLLGNSPFDIVPSLHLVNEFIGSHPRPFNEADLETLARSEKFFARKFEGGPAHPIRQRVLGMLRQREENLMGLGVG
jgi:hypothetical protein